MTLVIACGGAGKASRSTDGINWTGFTPLLSSADPYDAAWSPALSLWVMVGGSGRISTSPDGTTWTNRTSFTGNYLATVTWSPALALFVAAGQSGALATSPDGINWTSRTSGFPGGVGEFIWTVCWSPDLGLFVAAGTSGKLATSPDGINWTQRTTNLSTASGCTLQDVCWSSALGQFVVVGGNGSGVVQCATSPDGINWTSRTSLDSVLGSAYGGGTAQSVDYSPALGCYVASNNSNDLALSTDGITWTAQAAGGGTAGIIYTVRWVSTLGLFIIGSEVGGMSTSPSGTSWTARTSGMGSDYVFRINDDTTPGPSRTGTVTAAPALSASAFVSYARTGSLTASAALSAAALPAMVRTGDLAAAPVLTAVAVIDDGTRTGTVTAAPVLSAVAVAQLTRTAPLSAAAAMSATQTNQVSPQRTGSLSAAPALSATALISLQTRTGSLTAAPVLSGPGIPDVITPPGPPVVGKVDIRLRAYAPNGASMGLLPSPDNFQAAIPLNDVPSLTGTYAIGAARSSVLGQPIEVALEMTRDGGATWTEPDDCRFLYLTDARDPVKTADAYAWEAKGYIWRLSKARVRAEGALNGEGRREFSANVGTILSTLWSEAQARGALSGMTLVGNATVDANGTSWSNTINRSYDLGQDYLTILLDLAAGGYLDFRVTGRTVKLYNPNTIVAIDRTVTAEKVTLRPLQTTEAPFRRTWEGLADFVQVLGDEGTVVELVNAGGLAPWGRWEDFLAQAGVTDTYTLALIGAVYQQLTNAERVEYTQGLALGLGATPLLDFKSGDYVNTSVLDGSPDRFRVRQVTVQKDGNSVLGNVVLNDRFAEQDVRLRRMLDSIMSGASSGSTGGIPTPPGPDILQPAQVATPTGSSSVFVDAGGVAWGVVSLDWLDVTTNLDGTPITDLDHYEVQAKKGDGSATTVWSEVTRGAESRATASPYVPGDVWTFRVRAVDTSNNFGPWSTSLTLTIQSDTTGPAKPSTPTATSRLGVGTITWDGLPAVGVAMDADFDHVDIHLSNTSGFTYSGATKVSDLPGAGKALVGPLTYSATYYGRLVPYDTSGNAGTPSDQFSFVVAALVDVSNFPDDAMDDLYARTGHFLVVETNQINANSAAIGLLDTGYLIGAIVQGTEFWTNSNPTAGGMRLRDSDGFKAWNNSGVLMVDINRSTGAFSAESASIKGTIQTGVTGGQRILLSSGQIGVYETGGSQVGTIYGDVAKVVIRGPGAGELSVWSGSIQMNRPLYATDVEVNGIFSIPTNPTATTSAPNLRRGAFGQVFEAATSLGPADSGGSGFRLVRMAN